MKNKSILSMMEQLVMILVFALSAALCMQVFVFSSQTSRRYALRDRMVLETQNLAETLKSTHGDFPAAAEEAGGIWDGESWVLYYDSEGKLTEGASSCRIEVCRLETGQDAMGGAELTAYDENGGELFCLPIAWQEVENLG